MTTDITTDLKRWVADQLASEDETTAELLMAAFDGPDAVERVLAGDSAPLTDAMPATTGPVDSVWLQRLEVEGFRGIGPATTLYFSAGPGLTIVSGRNGSGKSSLAEGLEVALTGRTYRWGNAATSTQFDPAWRNLHTPAEPAIRLRLTRTAGDFDIAVEWPPGSEEKTALRRTAIINGASVDATELGWANALEVFRPMLSYEELGQSLLKANQRTTAQAFERGLGLQQLSGAADALNTVAKQVKGASEAEAAERGALRKLLESSDDPRAADLLAKLPNRITPTARVAAFTDAAVATEHLGGAELGHIARATPPDLNEVAGLAQRLRDAADTYATLRSRAETLDAKRLELLRRALDLHGAAGDETCPVCETGLLDGDWATRTRSVLESTSTHAREVDAAAIALRQARTAVQHLVETTPVGIDQSEVDLETQQRARAAWSDWAMLPDGDHAAADHVAARSGEVHDATVAWRDEAAAEMSRRRDEWASVARAILRWVDAFTRYREEYERKQRLAAAQRTLKSIAELAREHQIAPIRQRAQAMWSALRHESNVELGDLKVSPTKLDIPARVDGEGVGALRVMSQGELHALALALFLPRAASDASPFRFLVLDDPVQAMDPAKVEGLLTVLLDLARTRQVVVFSHDDRLAAAARRRMASPDAVIRLQTVGRGARSAVSVKPAGDAAGRYLSEASAFFKDKQVGPGLKAQVAGGLFRMAVEAAARDAWFRAGIKRGLTLDAMEAQWASAKRTKERLALATATDWYAWAEIEPHRGQAIRACNDGVHDTVSPALLESLLGAVAQTVKDLRRIHA